MALKLGGPSGWQLEVAPDGTSFWSMPVPGDDSQKYVYNVERLKRGGSTMIAVPIDWVPPPQAANEAASGAADRQATVVGENEPIRVVYGGDRLGGQISGLKIIGQYMYLMVTWCYGEIQAIGDVYLSGQPIPAEVTVEHKLGAPGQTVSSLLVAAYGAGFTNTYPGRAYSVLKFTSDQCSGFPSVEASITGMKISSSQGGAKAWSDEPAYMVADFVENTVYGMGRNIDWASVSAVAARNSGTIGYPAEKRRVIGLTIDKVQPVDSWLKVLCNYAGCLPLEEAGTIVLVPSAPASSAGTYTEENIVKDSLRLTKRGIRQVPTVVRVTYTDRSRIPYTDATATAYLPGVLQGSVPWREQQISLPGIYRYSQAYREAVERLNLLTTADLVVNFNLFDVGIKHQRGEVLTLSHPIGLTSKDFRITAISDLGYGRYAVSGSEYDATAYSDQVVTGPSTDDTTYPSPFSPPTPANLSVVEEIFQLETGRYATRLKVTWGTTTFPHIDKYRVQLISDGKVVEEGTLFQTPEPVWRSQIKQEGVAYSVQVAVVSVTGTIGTPASAPYTILGKQLRPGKVPYFFCYDAAGEVRFFWLAALDLDLTAHEIRYGPVDTADWNDVDVLATAIRIPTPLTTYVTRSIPPGQYRFFIKGLDSIRSASYPNGQETPDADVTTFDLDVGGDPDLFLAGGHDFVNPSLTNMVLRKQGGWVTDYGTVWNTMFGSALNTYTNPLSTYSGSGTSSLLTETFDLGQVYGGTIVANLQLTDLAGTASLYLETSTDGSNWQQWLGITAIANARYIRIRVTTTGHMLVTALGSVEVSVITQSETGEVTTLASGFVTVTLSHAFSQLKTIQLTPQTAGDIRAAGWNNVVLNREARYDQAGYDTPDTFSTTSMTMETKFDVACWDATNTMVPTLVKYLVTGL